MLKKDYKKNILFKSILHVNIDAPFNNYETARKMIEYIADQGVTYFAFNTKI